ncbi:MAG: MAPEG family protein [Endozoicomonas sp.]
MEQEAIFIPFLGMQLLTLLVWCILFARRTSYMSQKNIAPQDLISPEKVAELIPEHVAAPGNNFKNLFELPVLFYGLCLYLYVSSLVDTGYIVAACVFLAFRTLHSLVHCTYNNVMHRFVVYLISSLALWYLVIRASFQLISSF